MLKIKVSVVHELGQEEAARRLKMFLNQAQAKLAAGPIQAPGMPALSGQLEQVWNGGNCNFKFSAQGMDLEGTIEVTDKDASLTSKLPLAAMMIKGKLESSLTEALTAILKK